MGTRLLRLLQSETLVDMLAMIRGIGNGIVPLMWSCILFVITVYVAALVTRELLGESHVERVRQHFYTVPRAFLTMFRCSFGDCTTIFGTPIFEEALDGMPIPAGA